MKTAAPCSARFWLRLVALAVALAGVPLGLLLVSPDAALAQEESGEPATRVDTEADLRDAWANLTETHIELTDDNFLHQCKTGDPIRESPYPMLLAGKGHTIRQTCFEKRVLRQDGTGYLLLKNVKLTRGGSDGPGAAVTTRGEIKVVDSKVQQNLAEEPGGGIFSMRRATMIRSVITNNLANDDGGGVYARRGGVQVFDSTISNNLVDGSGGAIGSTGDILLVRSHSDGNTTDGDGGALYAEDASIDGLDIIQTDLAAEDTATSREARVLERKVRRLKERAEDLERMSERFDEWESCLSWVPVTEYGDAEGHFGYLFGEKGADPGYRPAITIDRSEWDDPDYEFLAFVGRDRPFTDRECGHEPGEGVD